MARFGFVGPTYSSQSVIADCQRTMNWYPEAIESGQGKSQYAMYETPGLTLFCALPTSPVRGSIRINSRAFKVSGAVLYEIFGDGTYAARANVGNDGNPVSMVTNGSAGNQLAVCSAGTVQVLNLKTNQVTIANGIQGVPVKIVWCSTYGIVQIQDSNIFQSSSTNDLTTFNPLSVQEVSVFPENIGSILAIFDLLWVLGQDGHAQVYYDSGANQFTPFDVVQGSFMEEGINAPNSLCMVDNTAFWIGGNQNGAGIAWRANGYTPMRISNHAIEYAWSTYPKKASDAIGYAYVNQGHTFWVLRFPSANNGLGATWVYDVATQMWHERSSSLTGLGAHFSTCHAFAFGQHLVGDWNTGNVYAMSIGTYTDNGQPIRRFRRAPHISTEQQRIFHSKLQLDLEVGLGPQPPLTDAEGNPRDPQIMLRWSDDGGQTWSNEHWIGAGQAGAFKTRAIWRRLGNARDRVYEVAVTDPIAWRIIDAYLEANPGFQPAERLNKQMAKMA